MLELKAGDCASPDGRVETDRALDRYGGSSGGDRLMAAGAIHSPMRIDDFESFESNLCSRASAALA